jgi:di/tricarboxylate transporter
MDRHLGIVLVVVGVGVVLLGVLVATGALSWFGRLPGDIRHEGASTRVFVPITSMILVSVVLTVVINLVSRLLR